MSRVLSHVFNPNYLLRRGSGAAYAAADGDALACGAAVEGAEDEGRGVGAVEGVEACPVYVVGGWGEGVVEVPEEGGCVG